MKIMRPPKTIQRYRDDFLGGRPSLGKSRTIKIDDEDATPTTTVPYQPPVKYVRGDCQDGARPCPHVGCPYNNYLTVDSRGNIKLAHGNREPEDVPPNDSCCLDIADQGGQTLERVAEILGLTRERIRQIEVRALAKLRIVIENEDEKKTQP